MSAPARPLPSPFVACFAYALRVCVPPKRWALLLLPAVGAVLFGLLATVIEDSTAGEAFADASHGLFGLVLPFACLVVGDAVLGAEVRSGTFTLTWLSPTPFATIVAARWAAGWALASCVLVPAMATAALVAGVPEGIGPVVVATIAGSAAYIGLFVAIGATFRRAALWSLGGVLLGERLLGGVLSGVAQLSPQWLALSTYGGFGPDADSVLREGVPSGWGAVVRLGIVTAVTLALAIRRVRALKLTGATD